MLLGGGRAGSSRVILIMVLVTDCRYVDSMAISRAREFEADKVGLNSRCRV
jgi:Zn-dependent protease with chaperone function